MSRLDSALERFTQALDRVQDALHNATDGDSAETFAPSQGEIQALQDERLRLTEELDHVRSDYASLQSLTDEVEARLDQTIESVRQIMRS